MLHAVGDEGVSELLQSPVVGGGQTGQGQLVVAGICKALHSLPVQHLRTFPPHRAAGEAGLTKPAAPDAPPEHLQVAPVVDNFCGGYDGFGGEVGPVQILHNSLGYHLGRSLPGGDGSQSAVRVVGVGVKGGDVYPGDVGNGLQKPVLGPVLPFGLLVQGDDFHRAFLPLPQGEEVHKVCQRLRIEGADATGKHQIPQPLAVPAVNGNLG